MILMTKKTILIDLDGVLNTYSGKYDADYIQPIKDGAYEFLRKLSKNFRIIIFTSRNLLSVSKWVIENKLEEFIDNYM
jgi:histidinol phosphatase-like enzyme